MTAGRLIPFVLPLLLIFLTCAVAQQGGEPVMQVKRIHMCKAVEEREPVGKGDTFSVQDGKVFCFTEVVDAGEETFVTHKWYLDDELIASVKLKVAGTRWRTWSSKNLNANSAGNWRVDIEDAQKRKLSSISFVVE